MGVVATQAIIDVSYGPLALALLRDGLAPAAVVERILNDVVLRLQVDGHEQPIAELRRLVEIAARQRDRFRQFQPR